MGIESFADRRAYQKPDDTDHPPVSAEIKEQIRPIYTAYFVKDIEALTRQFTPKHEKVFAHHATIAFKPSDISGISLGRESALSVLGRAYDERGDALLLEGRNALGKHLHITLSCANGISPIYSNELIEKALQDGTMEKIETPVQVDVVEGYFDGKKDVTNDD